MNIRHYNLSYISLTVVAAIFLLGLLTPLTYTHAEGCATNIGLCIPNELEGIVYTLTTKFGGAMVWLGGGLLDYSVQYLVVGMGEYLNGAIGQSIDKLWVLVRDVFNILFIFGIIYIGFRTILFSDDNSAKKALGWLIVAALMINFSLFITKAIVDVANATSYQIYSKMEGEGRTDGGGYTLAGGSRRMTSGVTDQFMDVFRLTTFADDALLQAYKDQSLLLGRLAIFGILMMIVMLIAAFVFAAGAFMMIGRFVAIIIFMILSPVMFLGLVFPLFRKYQDLWWRKFLQYAFVGPAYLFMLYLSLWVISGLAQTNFSFAQAFNSRSYMEGAFAVFLNFGIVAAFLIASLMVAQQMGVYGANASMGMLKSAGNRVRYGAQSFVGRNTVGRLAGGAQILNDYAEKSRTGRNLKRFLVTAPTLGMFDEKARRGIINKGVNAKFGGSTSRQDSKDWVKTRVGLRDSLAQSASNAKKEKQKNENRDENKQKNKQTYREQNDAFVDPRSTHEQLTTAIEARGQTIKNMTDDERADLGLKELTKPEVAMHLSDSHIDALQKEGYFSNTEIKEIKDARKTAQSEIAKKGTVAFGGTGVNFTNAGTHANAENDEHKNKMRQGLIAGKSIRDIGKLPVDIFKHHEMFDFITPSMVEERMRNGITGDDKKEIRGALNTHLISKHKAAPGPNKTLAESGIPENDPWRKWEASNSSYAAQFFA